MSQDGEVLTCNDSRIILHRLCRTPRNCQCKWLSAFLKAQWISADSFPFSVKFLFYTDTLESIVLPNLVPRLRIGDCFEIHNLHWELCDLLLSSHQNFLLEVGLCQCVFCKEPLSSWSSCISRNSDLSGSEYKYCACPIQLLSRVLDLIREKNLRVCPLARRNPFVHEILCEFHPIRQIAQQVSLCYVDVLICILVVDFSGFSKLVAQFSTSDFVSLLDEMQSPRRLAVTMLQMYLLSNWTNRWIILGQRSARSFPSGIVCFCHFLWDVGSDRWSTHRSIRDLRRALQVRELPAYRRGALLSRINPILWHTRLLPLLFALPHWL